MSKKDKEKAATAIAAGRVAIGAGAYLAPNLSGRLFGLDPDGNPQASYLGRLFGARDVALGAGRAAQPAQAEGRLGRGRHGLRRGRRRRGRAGRHPRDAAARRRPRWSPAPRRSSRWRARTCCSSRAPRSIRPPYASDIDRGRRTAGRLSRRAASRAAPMRSRLTRSRTRPRRSAPRVTPALSTSTPLSTPPSANPAITAVISQV